MDAEKLAPDDLDVFLELVEHRSIQAASRASGRSRGTYARTLRALRKVFTAPELMQRAPGQRQGVFTAEGEELARRATVMVQHWRRWLVQTRDALAQTTAHLRVAGLPGTFDLLADILLELRAEHPTLALHVIESPEPQVVAAVAAAQVDLGFGAFAAEAIPPSLRFEPLGALSWAVIIPRTMADRFPARVRLSDLDGEPLVVLRGGAARNQLERHFADYAPRPLVLNAAYEVASTPRLVEMVARGFAPAIVSHVRATFTPDTVVQSPLVDGPGPLTAGVLAREGLQPSPWAQQLIRRARWRFSVLSRAPGHP